MGLISGEHGVRNQERSLRRKYNESCCFTLKEEKKEKTTKMQPRETAGKGDRQKKELIKHLGVRVKK